ncbi:hypothetical protein H5410_063962 [Solanum commersonii]|uniref:Uncharacterized protein n=1 Tax=Solanum commersonii TaxID=4109 RepID=A0A9J5W0R2_SOLCO|nr:hypothetical protein H5410_063962 [Solanum commersonii]
MAITEFLLFVFTLGECFYAPRNVSVYAHYLLSGYTKKDVRSNEATYEIFTHGWGKLFYSGSWFLLAIWFIGRLSFRNSKWNWVQAFPTPSHQWTRRIRRSAVGREIPTSLSISEMFGFSKLHGHVEEMLSPLGPRRNFYLFK